MSLTAKQARFVEEYLFDLNGTAAAIRAGYRKSRARQQAYRLSKKPEVQEAIAAAIEERSKRTQVSQDEVIKGLKDEAGNKGEGSSPAARVQAWAWLGRDLSMFTDTTNLGGSVCILHEDALKELE